MGYNSSSLGSVHSILKSVGHMDHFTVVIMSKSGSARYLSQSLNLRYVFDGTISMTSLVLVRALAN